MANLLGEAIDAYVSDQIQNRQELLGKGLNNKLSNSELNLINNKNAWLKLASSVYIGNPTQIKNAEDESASTEILDKLKTLPEERLKTIGLNINEMAGLNLAKKTVLFNTLSEWDSKNQQYNFRSGIVNRLQKKDDVWNNNNSYGLGSPSKGLQPPPGLISFDLECLNRGSIKEANIEIKCFNKIQFEIIDLVYLRLGYHMLIEWGWDKYISSDEASPYKTMGNTVIEEDWFQGYNTVNFAKVQHQILKKRIAYEGNYDGFLGKVVNYDWNMENDGSFTINLKLISVGDVIESLKCNLAISTKQLNQVKESINSNRDTFEYKADSNEFKSIVVSQAAASTLHYDLFTDLINEGIDWESKKKGDVYLNIYQWGKTGYTAGKSNNYTFYTKESNVNKQTKKQRILEEEGFKEGYDDHLGYYMSFGEFLNRLKKLVIPNLSDDLMIDIDNDVDSNLCSTFPNLISLDPRICFITPAYTDSIRKSKNGGKGIYLDDYYKIVTGTGLLPFSHTNKTEALDSASGKPSVCIYGKIMNIYLNYDFIGKCLDRAMDDEGKVPLFDLLNKICSGVNGALGNTTNLEVTLRGDKIVTIIDQNPIPGLDSVFPQLKQDTVVNFNLFGFNTSNSTPTSNMVKDFKFSSKLTPKTAAQISIGAAAGGTKTANQDISGFANWNKGLEDNLAFSYDDPQEELGNKTLSTGTGYTITRDQIREIKKAWDAGDKDEYTAWGRKRSNARTYFGGESGNGYREVDECPITGRSYQDYTWDQYANAVNNYLTSRKNKNKRAKEEKDRKAKWQGDYFFYLVRAFIGKGQDGSEDDIARYFAMEDKFIKEGQKAFRAYKSTVNNAAFAASGNPSNQTGFIPLDLSVTCDGISGIKIYNALNINQDVDSLLPYQYKNISNFLIQKVNHKVSDNDWETSLETLSIPKIQPPNPNAIDLYAQEDGVYNPYNPGPDFTPTKQPWSAVFISYIVKKLAGVPFPVAAAHRIYANALYDAAKQWRNDGGVKYKRVDGTYSGWKVISPFRVEKGIYGSKIQDWFKPQPGDIFVYNRDNNTNVFSGGNWTGPTHGDIVTSVTDDYNWSISYVGGNVSNTAVVGMIDRVQINNLGNKLFVVLRPRKDWAKLIVEQAMNEYHFWSNRKETAANVLPSESNDLYQRMTEYWGLVGIVPSQWGRDMDQQTAAQNQQKSQTG